MKKLFVIVPALNEEKTIATVIANIPKQFAKIDEIHVLVVDDGSTDATAALALEAGAIVVKHPRNLGVGAAFATGLDRALKMGADLIVNMDADGQFDPAGIEQLIEPIIQEGYGFVTCTRFQDPANYPRMPRVKLWGNQGMCWIVNRITGGNFTDVSCGFRAYSREAALRLNLFGRFTYTQETFIDLASRNISMTEVALPVRGVREFGKSRVASNLFKYAVNTSIIIFRALRDKKPLIFFGTAAVVNSLLAIACFGFVGQWWLRTGHTTPWTSMLLVGTVFTMIGVGLGAIALLADQIGRGRSIQEQILYLEKKRAYANDSMQQLGDRKSERGNTGDIALPQQRFSR